MSSKNAPNEQSTTEPTGGDTTIVVDDPADFAKTRALRAIFDALDNYRRTRRKAQKLTIQPDNGFGDEEKREMVFGAAQEVLLTAEPLLLESDEGRELWKERTYRLKSTVVGLTPSTVGTYSRFSSKSARRVFSQGAPGVDGMESFVDGTTFYGFISSPSEQIRELTPDTETMNEPVRDVSRHLSDIGLGVDLSTEQQTKISEKTLDEVEEWRQKHI